MIDYCLQLSRHTTNWASMNSFTLTTTVLIGLNRLLVRRDTHKYVPYIKIMCKLCIGH